MINVSGFWLDDEDVEIILGAHVLGRAYLHQLREAHDLIADLDQLRMGNGARVARLTREIAALDGSHDSFVRASYHHMSALIEVTRDAELRDWLSDLRAQFFPDKLALVKAAYADEAGWAHTVHKALTPEQRTRMATIKLGEYTLAELVASWLDAGMSLGQRMLDRARIQAQGASTGPRQDEVHVTRVRSIWIRTVQGLVNGLDLMRLSDADKVTILAPLEESIELARRGEGADTDADAIAVKKGRTEQAGDG